jgi:otoferlin
MHMQTSLIALLLRALVNLLNVDAQGKAEFIGRSLARPVVKASNERYEKPNFPPPLEWFDVHRGTDKAGELLAAFELLQV